MDYFSMGDIMITQKYFFDDSIDSTASLCLSDRLERYSLVFNNDFNHSSYSMDLTKDNLLKFASFIQQVLQDQQ
jgi:hypothetical protein